jgi:hypothetical protein
MRVSVAADADGPRPRVLVVAVGPQLVVVLLTTLPSRYGSDVVWAADLDPAPMTPLDLGSPTPPIAGRER